MINQTNEMLQIIIENIPQLVFWKDKNGVFMGCNKKFSDSLGLSCPEKIIGKTDYDLTDEENANFFTEIDKKVINDNKAIYQNRRSYKNSNDEPLWFNINKVPLHDNSGNIIGVLGTMENITEQINLENKLRNNNIKYKLLIESTNTAYIILNEKTEIMETNDIFLKLLGADSLYFCLGKPLSLWIAPKYNIKFTKAFNDLLNGNPINDLELHLITEKNNFVYVSLHANIIENGSIKIFCLVRNISTRKANESKIFIRDQKKRDKLKQNIFALRNEIKEQIKSF